MERLNEKLGDACAGGGMGRRQFGVDDCNHTRIEDLVQQGASIRDARALFLAASNGQPETIKLLLRIGGRRLVNEQDEHSNTPLHVAAGTKDPICMKVLLDHGASKELVDRKGRTPWQGLQACKRSDAQFANLMGFDRIQKTAAMVTTQALEEDKFAQCRQLLTGQATAIATGASSGAAGSGGAWTAADDARLTRYNASQHWVVPIESKVVKRAHTAPCSHCGTINGFAINMNYYTGRRTESESFTKFCGVCMLVLLQAA